MDTGVIIKVVCLTGCLFALRAIGGGKPKKGRNWENEDRHRSSDADRQDEESRQRRTDRRGAFSEKERRTIQGYMERYNAHPGKLERLLPPGLAKKDARRGTLPSG